MKARYTIVLAMSFGCALSGCGGGEGSGTGRLPAIETTVTATSGGTVSLPGGPDLQIAAGALDADTTITIRQTAAQPASGALTAIYEFGPAGTTFVRPITVAFPVPAGTTAASIYWTKQGSTTEYESLPTTVTGTTASAEVTHFSSGYVGALDVTGTWAGTVTVVTTPAGGSPQAPVSIHQTRDAVQTGNEFVYTYASSTGTHGQCAGTIQNAVGTATCQWATLEENCTATFTRTDTFDPAASPMTMTTSYTIVVSDGPCAGNTYEVTEGTLTKLGSPPRDVSGTWEGSTNWTQTGPSVEPTSGTSTFTRVRTQTGSTLAWTSTTSSGSSTRCIGPIIGEKIHATCYRSSDGCRFRGTYEGTVDPSAEPMTETSVYTFTYSPGCSAYTHQSGTQTITRQ